MWKPRLVSENVTIVLLGVSILLVVIGIGWLLYQGKIFRQEVAPQAALATKDTTYSNIPLVGDYQNLRLRFSLKTPDGFTITELPTESGGGAVVMIQNTVGDGIQIIATPVSGNPRVLTEADVRRDIPEMIISQVERVEIGEQYTGIAFRSDNEAFEGDSREVWFYYRGTLYQISTYARIDSLLREIFSSWTFF